MNPPSEPRVKLVLFDIDGTLLNTDGAGRRAIHRALIEVFGDHGPRDHLFDGKTDPQIVREIMRIVGHDDTAIEEGMARVFDLYLACLEEELVAEGYAPVALPGVLPLLDALESTGDAVLGLLTGNLVGGARAKLAAVGIDPSRFRVGAFGSDHERRGELPAVAQSRAREELGLDVAGGDVVIIGDTPADIDCGRAIGARAIAVATGRYSVAELLAHDPVAAFEDLEDTRAVVRAIMQ